jgi:hypothetical protein
MLDYLNRVSIFDHSALALFLIVGADWAFTLIHVLQEWKGSKAPLWRVFGAVVGVRVPNWLGFVVFTIVLTAFLWGLGLVAIAGWLGGGAGALGALIGARVVDCVLSHWGLYALGYRPNPGLSSTILYSIEAIFILVTFWTGLSSAPLAALIGFGVGALPFIGALPLVWLLRVVPSLRHEPWERWTPLPAWTRD